MSFAASFPDVPEEHDNYNAIEYLKEHGVLDGYKNGNFGPDNMVNRAEAMKIIVNGFGLKNTGNYEESFDDVNNNDWFFNYVMAGKAKGIIQGYENGDFKPANTITRSEALKIILMAADVNISENIEFDVYTDVKTEDWYAPFALYARNHNIVMADDEGNIYPSEDMTRAEFAEIIYRMMIIQENGGGDFPLHLNWDYYESSRFPFKIKYDDKWQIIDNKYEVVFFKPDAEFFQYSPVRLYPNSAKVVVSLDRNKSNLGIQQYFANIRTVFNDAQYTEFEFGKYKALEVLYPEKRIVDWYIYLDTSEVLIVHTEYGDGLLGFQLPNYIKSMLSTLKYNEVSSETLDDIDNEDILSEIFSNILIENKGMEMLELLPDSTIIESDPIGVGTGIVDYYYSESLDYTFKYERASDLILDKRKGRTSTF